MNCFLTGCDALQYDEFVSDTIKITLLKFLTGRITC